MQTSTIQAPQCFVMPTTLGTIFTTPTNSAIISAITVANVSGAAITVSISLYNGSTDYYIAYNAPIAVGDTLEIGGNVAKLMLTNGWLLRGIASAANAAHVTISSLAAS